MTKELELTFNLDGKNISLTAKQIKLLKKLLDELFSDGIENLSNNPETFDAFSNDEDVVKFDNIIMGDNRYV